MVGLATTTTETSAKGVKGRASSTSNRMMMRGRYRSKKRIITCSETTMKISVARDSWLRSKNSFNPSPRPRVIKALSQGHKVESWQGFTYKAIPTAKVMHSSTTTTMRMMTTSSLRRLRQTRARSIRQSNRRKSGFLLKGGSQSKEGGRTTRKRMPLWLLSRSLIVL